MNRRTPRNTNPSLVTAFKVLPCICRSLSPKGPSTSDPRTGVWQVAPQPGEEPAIEIFEERPGTDSKANRDRCSQLPACEEPSSSVTSSSGPSVTRRQFIERSAATAAVGAGTTAAVGAMVTKGARPALLGGKPTRTGGWPSWPVADANDEAALIEVLRSGNWFRYRGGSERVDQFEVGMKYDVIGA